jgi:flagella basal body P-ring formation protein FlgA
MNNQRLSRRKQIQLLIALTILAWATQTLIRQWGYGQTVAAPQASVVAWPTDGTNAAAAAPGAALNDANDSARDKFVPSASDSSPSGTLEVCREAVVSGADVKLKQVCRWADSDAAVFVPLAETTIAQLGSGRTSRIITVSDITQTLHDAGVNVAMINFAGAGQCEVSRSDAQTDGQQTVQQWLDAQPAAAKASPGDGEPKTDPDYHPLRDLLVEDLADRLGIAVPDMQVTFGAQDEKLLSLAEPLFHFDISPSRARALGTVSWEVTVLAGTTSKRVTVSAVARAIENQVVVAEPIAAHTVLSAANFTTRRKLVDSAPGRQFLTLEQCVGQEAAEDLHPGTVMTSRLVMPAPMVKPGQLVTVNLRRGTIELRSVARAMEQGTMGQTIRVRNENTRDVLEVQVTGPKEARLGDTQDGN